MGEFIKIALLNILLINFTTTFIRMKKTYYCLTNLLLVVAILATTATTIKANNAFLTVFINKSLEKSVSGVITDSNGEPLVGVNVVVKGTSKGVLSDVTGAFKINVEKTDVLVFSFVGFKNQEITVGEQTVINVKMEDGEALSTMTVVGSRFAKPRTDVDRPVPIDVIGLKEIQQAGQVDLGQALQFSAPSTPLNLVSTTVRLSLTPRH
jgi:iron complex outermembrane recepter protein